MHGTLTWLEQDGEQENKRMMTLSKKGHKNMKHCWSCSFCWRMWGEYYPACWDIPEIILQVLHVPKGPPPFAMPGNPLKKGPGGILIRCLHSPTPSSLCMSSSLMLYCCWGFRHLRKETSFFQKLVCLLLFSVLA